MRPVLRSRRDAAAAAAILVLVVALRWSGFAHEFVLFDDYAYVTENPAVRGGIDGAALRAALTGIVAGHWHPLTIASLAANVEISGLRAGPIVMTNVALHGVNAALVFLLLRALGLAFGASLFGGLLFALHPAHVESYAWIAERKDVLSALFFLLALLAWLRWTRGRNGGRRAYAAALGFFALSLLAKPMAVTLPAILLLLEVWPGRARAVSWRRRFVETIPFFAFSGIVAAVAIATQRAGGAMRGAALTTPLDRLENAIVAWSWTLRTWFVPNGLAVFHPWRDHAPWALARDVALLAAVTAGAVLAHRRARCGAGASTARGDRGSAILVGWLWFVVMLLPVSGLVQVGLQSVADRYLYLPGIGILVATLAAVSCLVDRLAEPGAARAAARRTLPAFALVWLMVLGGLSYQQFALWRSSERLFRQAAARHPESAFAHHLLGLALVEQDRWSDAEAPLRRAIQLQTGGALRKGAVYETWLPQAYVKMAEVLRRQGRSEDAVAHAEAATRLAPRDLRAWLELGDARAIAGRPDAAAAWERAAAIDPRSFDAQLRVGIARAIEGETAGSIRALETAVRLRPSSVEARVQLALSLVAADRTAEAVEQLEAARATNRAASNDYLERAAGFTPGPDTLERYIAYLRGRE